MKSLFVLLMSVVTSTAFAADAQKPRGTLTGIGVAAVGLGIASLGLSLGALLTAQAADRDLKIYSGDSLPKESEITLVKALVDRRAGANTLWISSLIAGSAAVTAGLLCLLFDAPGKTSDKRSAVTAGFAWLQGGGLVVLTGNF